MSTAIKISNSIDCTFNDITITGFDVGIDLENVDGLNIHKTNIDTSKVGIQGTRVTNSNFQELKIRERLKENYLKAKDNEPNLNDLVNFLVNQKGYDFKVVVGIYNKRNLRPDTALFK